MQILYIVIFILLPLPDYHYVMDVLFLAKIFNREFLPDIYISRSLNVFFTVGEFVYVCVCLIVTLRG